MALFITECPHCNTSFRTRISQLQSADGMVRCGACLKIFVADDNLVPSPDLHTVTVEVTHPTPTIDSQLSLEGSSEQTFPAHETHGIDDEIVTLDLADSLPNRITPSISEHHATWEILDEEENLIATPQKPNVDEIHDSTTHEDFSAENLTAMRDFAEPLELDWRQPRRQLRGLIGMWAVAIVLIMGLVGQFLWYQHDSLSQNITVRPWMERTCTLLHCALAPIVDIRAIGSEKLLVRSHPEIANALSVNLVVRNDAAFAQPFPVLNLRFTTASNELVAARQFTPSEYLTPEVAALGMMPSGAPVQVAMDILDPGSRAINYEVSFSPMLSQAVR